MFTERRIGQIFCKVTKINTHGYTTANTDQSQLLLTLFPLNKYNLI